ncbi:MAG: ABC transporter permease [Proteocatella sp.]
MLIKLAFKNVGKSIKEYAVYFFTLVLGVCVFYMFNSIDAQTEIMVVTQTTNEAMKTLTQILSYISVFVSVLLGFLVVYANNFFIKRRKKEFGIYMTLGMDKLKLSAILILETSGIAILALITGLGAGVFMSQFMSVFTAKIFEADMSAHKFIFAPEAAAKSIIYFGIIFLIVMMFNMMCISKFKLIDLIHGGKKNETLKIKNMKFSVLLFIVSLVMLGISYAMIIQNGMMDMDAYFSGSIILGIMGTFLFFFSLTGFAIRLIANNKKLYYKDLNMFVLRQINSKINTNFISISVVCIVLLLTIGIFSSGYSLQNAVSSDLKKSVPYDISIFDYSDFEDESIVARLPEEFMSEKYVSEYDEFVEYVKPDLKYGDVLTESEISKKYLLDNPISFIKLTDYNESMEMQGKEKLKLDKNSYAMVSTSEMYRVDSQKIIDNKTAIDLENDRLLPMATVLDTATSDNYMSQMFVVEDKYTANMEIIAIYANINCVDEEASQKLDKNLELFMMSGISDDKPSFSYFMSRTQIYEDSITSKALVSFLAIYLGFVFLITSAAILAIQQLSEAEDNKHRYKLLSKIGVDRKMLDRALFVQIAFYFMLPLGLAVLHSIVGLSVVNNIISAVGKVDVTSSIISTSCFIGLIYGMYFFVTYISCKNIVDK